VTELDIEAGHEAVAIFHRTEDFQNAIDALLSSGFDRAELSLLASETAVAAKLGHHYRKASGLADDPGVPRAAYVSTEAIGDAEGALVGGLFYVGATLAAGAVVASGGTLAAALAATLVAGGVGGLIGSTLAHRVGVHHGRYLQDQLERGGLLLWVHIRNLEEEGRAVRILRTHCGDEVHVHALPQRS
jgi:hypothetical protein